MPEILERGDVGFFFRPTVQPAEAPLVELGVQSFFLILSAAGGRHRRVRVGRKRMPGAGERLWAEVERVGSLAAVLADVVEDERYATKTRGERLQPGARPIAQGCYALVQHDDHLHFEYQLTQREPAFDVPEEIALPAAGNHMLLFKRRPRGRAVWTTAGSPSRLDHPGEQLVLVGGRAAPLADGPMLVPAEHAWQLGAEHDDRHR